MKDDKDATFGVRDSKPARNSKSSVALRASRVALRESRVALHSQSFFGLMADFLVRLGLFS